MVEVDAYRFRISSTGFTIVELLVVMVIVAIAMTGVGVGFARLSQLEDINREKACVMEAICRQFERTQPYVAAGCSATTVTNLAFKDGCVRIAYPHIVFGIACETNRFTFVTNTTISVRSDGALQTVIEAGRVTGMRSVTNAIGWMEPLFVKTAQPWATNSSVRCLTNEIVVLNYEQGFVLEMRSGVGSRLWTTNLIGLTMPIRLRNRDYQ